MTTPRSTFDERGLLLGERRVPFYAGAMHYWRVPRKAWAACLRTMHAQGFTLVETPVPWREHAAHGWTKDHDLAAFCAAAQAAGLGVVLRVGPAVNAELTNFGLPDAIVADAALQARTSRGTPAWLPAPPRAFPVPSYASAAFHAKVRTWYAEIAAQVTPLLAPAGPVVALAVDHATQLFYRLGAYDLDYHPDALTWWSEYSGEASPPRAWDTADRARCVSWVRFKEHYVERALRELCASLDAVGLGGIARFHDLAPGDASLVDARGAQHAIGGPVGIAAISSRAELRELRRRAAAVVGTGEPLPLAAQVSVGSFAWLTPLDDGADKTRERDQLLSLLAVGVRGFALQMAVERDRHHGAAITYAGTLEPHAAWIAPLLATLAAVEWTKLRRTAPIALVDVRADLRFGLATSVADPFTPVLAGLLNLGPAGAAELGADVDAHLARRWFTALAAALELAQVPYVIVDEATPEAELARYRAVIAPTLDRIDGGLWQRLRALAEHKRAIVVIGPTTPTHDELGQPLPADAPPRRIGKIRDGSLGDLPGLAADLSGLVEQAEAWQVERPDEVRCFAHATIDGDVRVVFVTSDAAKPVTATLLAAAQLLRDPFTSETFRVVDGRAQIAMPARGVRMLLVD